jgi:tetratricopeptide (TPR) repeat protein
MARKKTKNRRTKKQSRPGAREWDQNHKIGIAALLVITFLVFSPALSFDFVNWDDNVNITENPYVEDLTFDNIKKIFSTHVIGNYNPLSILTFAIETELVGMDNPWFYHLNNILLHLLCVFLVFRFGMWMRLNFWGSLLLAALFALHPLRVESVTWVTERKDVLYGAFFLAALNRYVRSVRNRKPDHVWISVFFILSLLSKIQAVTLPLTMIAVDYYLHKEWKWSFIWKKWWYFLLSLITGLVGIYFLGQQGSINADERFTFIERLLIGTYSLGVYLVKSVVPYQMSPLYPYLSPFPWHMYLGIPASLAFLGALYYFFRKQQKPVVFGLVFFLFNIFFLLQFLGAGQGFQADRFTYIAYIGLFFIPAFYFQRWQNADLRYRNYIPWAVGVLVAIYAFISYRQNYVWKNSEALWTHVIGEFPKTPVPYGNRGNWYRDQGRNQEAIQDYNSALELEPDRHSAYNSRGKLFFDQGNYDQALNDYNKAIEITQTEGEYYVNRGAALAYMKRYDEAISDFEKGLELKPNHAVGYLNRFIILNNLQRYEEALADATKYLLLRPGHADMYYERAIVNRRLNKLEDSRRDIQQAISINPNKGLYYLERSRLEYTQGNKAKALDDALRARQLGKEVDEKYIQTLRK